MLLLPLLKQPLWVPQRRMLSWNKNRVRVSMTSYSRCALLIFGALFCLAASGPALAQRLRGELLSEGNAFRRSFQIPNDGHYVLQDLPFGVYRLNLSAEGFAAWSDVVEVHSEVPLKVGVTLGVAPVTTKVEVTDEIPLVDPT